MCCVGISQTLCTLAMEGWELNGCDTSAHHMIAYNEHVPSVAGAHDVISADVHYHLPKSMGVQGFFYFQLR